MHLLVPKQVVPIGWASTSIFEPYGRNEVHTYYQIPGTPLVPITKPKGLLRCTHRGRTVDNDCVHAKLMDYDESHPILRCSDWLLLSSVDARQGRYSYRADAVYNKGWTYTVYSLNRTSSKVTIAYKLQGYVGVSISGTRSRSKRQNFIIQVVVNLRTGSATGSRYSGAQPPFLDALISEVRDATRDAFADFNPSGTSTLDTAVADIMMGVGKQFCDWIDANYTSTYSTELYEIYDPFPGGNVKIPPFLFNEDKIAKGSAALAVENAGTYANYWLADLQQKAFYDCLQSVPRMNENNVSNIVEVVKFLKSLIVDKRIEFPESLADGWLAYRYTYSTGKSDIEAALDYAKRHLRTDSGYFHCYGSETISYEGVTVRCNCRVRMKNKNLSYLDQIWKNLDMYGLSPRFYVFWDMLPYSFIADWFIPIGDVLSVVDARSIYSEDRYDYRSIVYSISYIRRIDDLPWKFYTRWVGSAPPDLHGFYWFETDPVSDKTVGYRTIDAAALILGRKG